MLEMLAIANSAFAIIKQTLENGKEISSAGQAIARFVGAEEQLQRDLHKKRNSIWTNFLGKTDNDLEEFMALEQIRVKHEKLREFMQLYGTPGSWNMFLQFEREARLQVKKEREEAEKRRKKKLNIVKNIAITFLFVVLVGAIITIGLMIFLSANQ